MENGIALSRLRAKQFFPFPLKFRMPHDLRVKLVTLHAHTVNGVNQRRSREFAWSSRDLD